MLLVCVVALVEPSISSRLLSFLAQSPMSLLLDVVNGARSGTDTALLCNSTPS